MSLPFDAVTGLVLVQAELIGPTGPRGLKLALDTASERTTINADVMIAAGYDLEKQKVRDAHITTASDTIVGSIIEIRGLRALQTEVAHLLVAVYALPNALQVDGLIGLDFLRGQCLTVDFRTARVSLR